MPEIDTPENFLRSIENAGRRQDASEIMALMTRITGLQPKMSGDSIIGFGTYDYARADGSEHSSFMTGLSPRKANLVVYIMPGFDAYKEMLARLGPHKHTVCCLYLGRISKINMDVLEELITAGFREMQKRHPDHMSG